MLQALHTDNIYIRSDGRSDSNTNKRHIAQGGTSTVPPYTSKSFCCHLGSITLSASANLPVSANVSHTASHIMLPITGSVAYENQGNKLEARAGHTGVFLSDAKFVSKTINYSGINVYFDKLQLIKTAKMMIGSQEASEINFSDNRHLHLNPHPTFSFDITLRHLHNVVINNHAHPEILRLLGMEDLFYRYMVFLLKPELLPSIFGPITSLPPIPRGDSKLDAVCDYILANLRGVITLPDLEAHSGLSVRTLQYQFKKRFNCTPVEWIRKERLKLVYLELLAPENKSTTIFCIALRCGFNHAGEFSKQFGLQYGASPSEVRSRGY
jgi:AraC-like DNA-binding protein